MPFKSASFQSAHNWFKLKQRDRERGLLKSELNEWQCYTKCSNELIILLNNELE